MEFNTFFHGLLLKRDQLGDNLITEIGVYYIFEA
jgi:hypothetical protein